MTPTMQVPERRRVHLRIHPRGKTLRRDKAIAGADKTFDLFPINVGSIQIKPEPSVRTDVGRHGESRRFGSREPRVFARHSFAAEGESPVTVMVDELVRKAPPSHEKCGVLLAVRAGFRQGKADLGEFRETAMFLTSPRNDEAKGC
jgi:hypothetical protein